ncbi:MAG: hypothetical protein N2316_09440 [Spirochaetes bacterium]|nr:hypothetical protein [Spirochaetota bacterium]
MDSPQALRLRYMALIYAILFSLAVFVFIFFPNTLFRAINALSLMMFPSLPLATDSGKFWFSLAISMMGTIIALSLFIYKNVRKYYMMAIPLAIAKFTSSCCGLFYFVLGYFIGETNTLANLLIFLTDFPLGVVAFVFWRNAKKILPPA